jgi:putative transposase
MIKSIKIMLLPNNRQATKLHQTADASRYSYNWTVALQMKTFEETGTYLSDSECRKLFTQHKKENQWLYNTSNNAAKQAIKDCCNAFWRFISEKKKSKYTPYSKKQIQKAAKYNWKLSRYDMQWHPKFKKKSKAEPKFYVDTAKIQFSGTHVKLENIANSKRKNRARINWIKLAEKERVPFGKNVMYTNPRVTYDGIHWWISVGIECEAKVQSLHSLGSLGIGIDAGIKDLAITSNGYTAQNINKTVKVKKMKQKQRRLQRSISRKYNKNKKGESYCKTSNIIKSEKQLLKVNQRLTGIRHNHVHQTTSEIVKTKPSFIVCEDLNVTGMMKNKHLSKAVQEQCLAELTRQIEYKCNWNGIKYMEANRYFPSSKTCSCCGNVKSDLKLSDRTYLCEECGLVIDRDLNAAINLKKYGERMLA